MSPVRAALIAVVFSVSVGCATTTPGLATAASGTWSARTSSAPTTKADARILHPAGYQVAKGAVKTLADVRAGRPATLRLSVGDLVSLAKGTWLPDNSPYSTVLDGTLVLAADEEGQLIYQAVATGSVLLAVGPIGHPGGCDQPGRNCADATPPPLLNVEVS